MFRLRVSPFSVARSSSRSIIISTVDFIENHLGRISSFPASILERSRISLMSDRRFFPLRSIILR
jgi:hypothetical protein